MGLTIKTPVKKIIGKTACETVEEKLKNDKENAYTIMGLMVECFGVKEEDISGKSFSKWKKGHPTLYSRIRHCLNKLVKVKKVEQKKSDKAVHYWWVAD